MPGIAISESIAANTMSDNLLSGQEFEFLPRRCIVSVAATGSAAGLRMYFEVGGRAIASNYFVPATNRFPIVPDDSLVAAGSRGGGERLVLRMLNTTAGALTAIVKLNIDY